MHISEGVLDIKIVAGGFAAAAGLTALALKKVRREDIPRLAVMGAAFFVSSLIHFKVGITSVHFTLIGLMGLMLGIPSVLAILTGLFFQAVMFQHGGLSTLGVNTALFSLPALLIYALFSPPARRWKDRKIFLSIVGGVLSGLGVLLAAALILVIITLSGEELAGVAFVFSISHGVLALLEGSITFLVVQQVLRVKPDMLHSLRQP